MGDLSDIEPSDQQDRSLQTTSREKLSAGARDVVVVTNPSAGQDQPFLKQMNAVFKAAGLTWEISLTMKGGDGNLIARRAADDGARVVVAFGGDGTVVDVASGLVGTQVPLGIIPGGTANMMSRAFGIPQEIEAAAALIANHSREQIYPVYIGKANQSYFQQLIGIGLEAQIVEGADRAAKDKLGFSLTCSPGCVP
jgi:diacylglycerol kinase family enzyme